MEFYIFESKSNNTININKPILVATNIDEVYNEFVGYNSDHYTFLMANLDDVKVSGFRKKVSVDEAPYMLLAKKDKGKIIKDTDYQGSSECVEGFGYSHYFHDALAACKAFIKHCKNNELSSLIIFRKGKVYKKYSSTKVS